MNNLISNIEKQIYLMLGVPENYLGKEVTTYGRSLLELGYSKWYVYNQLLKYLGIRRG